MKSTLLIVDDWELQERYEEVLSKLTHITCSPFSKDAIETANVTHFDLIILYITHDDLTTIEAVKQLIECAGTNESHWIIVESAENHPLLSNLLHSKLLDKKNEKMKKRNFLLKAPPYSKEILFEDSLNLLN